MRTIETDLVVTTDGRANVLRIPADVRGGQYRAVLVIDDEPLADVAAKKKGRPLHFSSYSVGVKDPKMTFGRGDLYGDNGR